MGTTRIIEAQELVIRDKDGRLRGNLGITGNNLVSLELRGDDERRRMAVFVSANGCATLSLGSEQEDRGVLLSKTNGGVHLSIATANGAAGPARRAEAPEGEPRPACARWRGVWHGWKERVRRGGMWTRRSVRSS